MGVSNMMREKLENTIHKRVVDLIQRDYSIIAGDRIQNMFASDIVKIVDSTLKEPWRLGVGQILWMAVDKDDRPSYGKSAKNIRLIPVVLTLVSNEDLRDMANGFSEREVREKRIVRLFNEAFEQNGLLSHNDTAVMLRISVSTVGKQVREYMEREKKVIPTRGTVHDLGPAMTHKKFIIKLYLEGYLTPEIAKKCNHSEEACDRYIKAFNKVRRLATKMTASEIARTLEISPYLVREYLDLLDEQKEVKI